MCGLTHQLTIFSATTLLIQSINSFLKLIYTPFYVIPYIFLQSTKVNKSLHFLRHFKRRFSCKNLYGEVVGMSDMLDSNMSRSNDILPSTKGFSCKYCTYKVDNEADFD